ncbi:MAG: outer membrane beta-barrel protein [Bradyrhizobium sp.]
MPGPATGRRERVTLLRVALPCLALITIASTAQAQTLPSDLLRPVPESFLAPQDSPLRKTSENRIGNPADGDIDGQPADQRQPAPSRIGNIPKYGLPAASGAADAGFDSLNRTRKQPKLYPGQAKPKPPPGPGTPVPTANKGPANPNARARISPPPSLSANRPPVSSSMAGVADGQPARKPLPVDTDPFGAVGDYAGSFLIKSAVELRGGYDTNPGRVTTPIGAPFWVVAPELSVVSDWERHALVADLRGSFTGYGSSLPPLVDGAVSSAPTNINRPDFTGHIDGRIDVTQDTSITEQVRLRVGIDNPGSPNIAAGLAAYPVYATFGSTIGIDQRFNRLEFSGGATFDRTVYQNSVLTDGTIASNADRAYNQYGGIGRVSYDLLPGVKPFVEAEADSRFHDQLIDNSGFARNSTGGYAKGGTSFQFSQLLTGEIAVGFAERNYADPRLGQLSGLLTSSSLTWTATPLTSAKFYSTTSIDETIVPGVSGVLSHTYTFEVDHDFRRWLTAVGKFTYGTYDYQGDGRFDKTYSVEGDLIYKLTRNLWIKGTLRHDVLDSNVPLASSTSNVVMLGVRVQN